MNASAAFPHVSAPLVAPSSHQPPVLAELAPVQRGAYRLRLARTWEDVRAAQVLRFLVFNVELQLGLEESYSTCRDADAYDAICDHLLVEDQATGEVVGTYRLQSGERAAEHLGYYSALEFDCAPFEPLRSQLVELGRACVHSSHRNFFVLNLLWRGIADYATALGCRYLIGCSSVASQDAAAGLAAYQRLEQFLVSREWRTRPLPGYDRPGLEPAADAPKIPKLLTAYLALGARICGPPAIDTEFKTIVFLTFLDLQALPAWARARYLS